MIKIPKGVYIKTEIHKNNLRLSHLGKKLSEEHRKKISLARIGKKQSLELIKKRVDGRKGYSHDDVTKKKIGDSNRNKKRCKKVVDNISNKMIKYFSSDENRLKRSQRLLKFYAENPNQKEIIRNTRLGKKSSEETRRKMSLAHKGKKLTDDHKKRISIASKGKKKSELSVLKMARSIKENYDTGRVIPYWLNKHPSEETIKKFKEFRKTLIVPFVDSSIEVKIQNFLKDLRIVFFTHKYIDIIHGYQCDIFISKYNLIIECDGNYWHKYPFGTEKDHVRTKELLEKGYKLLRLWESDIRSMNKNQFRRILKTKICEKVRRIDLL